MSTQPARQRSTIRDVAALAGVGIKTVSRVINDEPNVSPEMRERVQRAVKALNFKPHLGAGALRRRDSKSKTIGLLLDAVDNPFAAAINRAVELVARARHSAVFAASSDDDPDRERELIEAFTRRRVDALILSSIATDHSYLHAELDQGTPIVFIDRPAVGIRTDTVLTDNRDGSAEATRHLITHGHHKIAHLGDDLHIATARERRQGFVDAMTAAGLSDRWHADDIVSEEMSRAAVHAMMRSDDPPTALFTAQNMITMGAIRALRDLGLQHRVAIVGFDDMPMADLLEPAVTVLAQNAAEVGTRAAECAFSRLNGDTSTPRTLIVPTRLIIRGSGEIRPRPAQAEPEAS